MKKTQQKNKSNEKLLAGIATRDSKDKCVPVLIERSIVHPIYRKSFKISKKYLCFADSEVKKGQKVIIAESRPRSKRISWKVIRIIKDEE